MSSAWKRFGDGQLQPQIPANHLLLLPPTMNGSCVPGSLLNKWPPLWGLCSSSHRPIADSGCFHFSQGRRLSLGAGSHIRADLDVPSVLTSFSLNPLPRPILFLPTSHSAFLLATIPTNTDQGFPHLFSLLQMLRK